MLRVISSSSGELEPVFQEMLENATRICAAKFGNLLLYDGKKFRVYSHLRSAPSRAELRTAKPGAVVSPPNSPIARAQDEAAATRTRFHEGGRLHRW